MSINAETKYFEPNSNRTYFEPNSNRTYLYDGDQIKEVEVEDDYDFGDSDNEEMYTKTPNAKISYLQSGSVMSKEQSGPSRPGSRKPSVVPIINFNMPNLTLDSRNFTVKEGDTDSNYTYNPR
jgi:hypothetical protein